MLREPGTENQTLAGEKEDGKAARINGLLVAAVVILAFAVVYLTGVVVRQRKQAEARPQGYYSAAAFPRVFHSSSAQPGRAPAMSGPAAAASYAWDPFAEMERMQEEMNRMFNESFRHASLAGGAGGILPQAFFEPEIDFQDRGDHYLLTMDIPGMEKDKLNIDVADNVLTVSGERTSEAQNGDRQKGFYSMERRTGAFSRTIPLPPDASGEGLKAGYEKGELRIEIPKDLKKAAGAQPRKIPVQ